MNDDNVYNNVKVKRNLYFILQFKTKYSANDEALIKYFNNIINVIVYYFSWTKIDIVVSMTHRYRLSTNTSKSLPFNSTVWIGWRFTFYI